MTMGDYKYGGSCYETEREVADAWAHDALPDPSVIGAEEDEGTAATELVNFHIRELERTGEYLPVNGAMCAAAVARRIRARRAKAGA
jgi:hypothetical protein